MSVRDSQKHEVAADERRTALPQGRQCLMVLGMHRSGTSALTRVLNLVGADLPATLMPPKPNNNETGFWESIRLFEYHTRFLREMGSSWQDWRRLDLRQISPIRIRQVKDDIGALIDREYGASRLFVLKDPRICRFLPLYVDVLREREINPYYVISLRNPLAVAASLADRDRLSTSFSCLVWLGHVLEAEKVTRAGPRVFVGYEQLLADWRAVIARISQGFGIVWRNPADAAAPDIEQFLSRGLQHHESSQQSLDLRSDIAPWIKRAYAALLQLQNDPSSQGSIDTLDKIRAEFEPVAPIFGEAMYQELEARTQIHAEAQIRQAREAEAAFRQQDKALRQQEAAISSLSQDLASHAQQITMIGEELNAHTDRIARLDSLLALRESRISELTRALAHTKLETIRIQSAVADRDARLSTLEQTRAIDREQRDVELTVIRQAQAADRAALTAEIKAREHSLALWRAADAARRMSISWYLTWPVRAISRGAQVLAYNTPGYQIILIARYVFQRGSAALREWEAIGSLRWSGLFDRDWYLKNNPDVAAAGVHPIRHYVSTGVKEGRDPSPTFSTRNYLVANPDVAAAGLNPLVHFVRHGAAEGRCGSGISTVALPPQFSWQARLHRMLPRAVFWDRWSFRAQNRFRNGFCLVLPRAVSTRVLATPPLSKEAMWRLENDQCVAVPFTYVPELSADDFRLAVICHIYFEDIAPELQRYLRNIPFGFDLFISTDTSAKQKTIERLFAGWSAGMVELRLVPNRGRDIAPKLTAFRDVYDRYEYVLHLHSKGSTHLPVLKDWRGFLLENLLGSPKIVESIFAAFSRRRDLGIISGQHYEIVGRWINWRGNFELAHQLARRMGMDLSPDAMLDFPAGSMFWARSAALRPLLDLDLSISDFPPETGQLDATLAHAIERLYFLVCEHAGYKWIKVARPELARFVRNMTTINAPEAIDAFIATKAITLSRAGPSGVDAIKPVRDTVRVVN